MTSNHHKSLVVLAAGMGSRFKTGVKQLHSIGKNGETILDYSIYDAIKVGFEEIVFIIREDIENLVAEHFLPRWDKKVKIKFAYQKLSSFTEGIYFSEERKKPWGTAHALLCGKDLVKNSFAIINADDFYGHEAFAIAAKTLDDSMGKEFYGLICYQLFNTLSAHGSVNRGICQISDAGNLMSIKECLDISKNQMGLPQYTEGHNTIQLSTDTPVSMNFFCFSPHIFEFAQSGFHRFLQNNKTQLKAEYFIPLLVHEIMHDHQKVVKAFQTPSEWFGLTYQEDNTPATMRLEDLIKKGVYPSAL